MSGRQLVGLLALGAAGYGLWRRGGLNLPPTLLTPPTALPGPAATPPSYKASTIRRESGGDPMADNPRSTASGLYQFTEATWRRMGGQWGPDNRKPFGGLAPSIAEQTMRFDALTRSNGGILQAAGIRLTNGALYAAHFLGAGVARRVLAAPASTSLASLVGSKVMAANPQLRGFTAGDFRRWVEAKA